MTPPIPSLRALQTAIRDEISGYVEDLGRDQQLSQWADDIEAVIETLSEGK
jgi:hypothetical protein